MSALFQIIAIPLGWLMKACYLLVKNYGIALILFTVLIRLLLLPLNIKQQKSSARMAKLQPELQKLQKKYANNKEKYQEEMMNLYAKENASPTAGCLPMLITFLVLFALIEVIYNPLKYVTNVDKDKLETSNELISNLYTVSDAVSGEDTTLADMIAGIKKDNPDYTDEEVYKELKSELSDISKIDKLDMSDKDWNRVMTAIELHNDIDTEFMLNEDCIAKNLAKSRPALLNFSFLNKANGTYANVIDIADDSGKLRKEIDDFDFTFFGIHLEEFPKWNGFNSGSLLVLVPASSFLLQLIMTFVSQHYTKKNNPTAAQAMGGGMTAMLYIMPIFSLWITFRYPVGLGIYWTMSSLVGLAQTVFLNKVYTPEHVQELIDKEDAKKKKSGKKSFMERALEAQQMGLSGQGTKKPDNDDEEETEEKKLSKAELKELQRKKLNEARKRMAEKYGDEYKED